jgi:chorismate mutase
MTLEEIRRQIDAIDPQIKELFLKRMATSYEVAKTKYEAGETTIYRADREADIIRRLTADVDPNLVEEYTAMVWKIKRPAALLESKIPKAPQVSFSTG